MGMGKGRIMDVVMVTVMVMVMPYAARIWRARVCKGDAGGSGYRQEVRVMERTIGVVDAGRWTRVRVERLEGRGSQDSR